MYFLFIIGFPHFIYSSLHASNWNRLLKIQLFKIRFKCSAGNRMYGHIPEIYYELRRPFTSQSSWLLPISLWLCFSLLTAPPLPSPPLFLPLLSSLLPFSPLLSPHSSSSLSFSPLLTSPLPSSLYLPFPLFSLISQISSRKFIKWITKD